jgi:hypothetical protein
MPARTGAVARATIVSVGENTVTDYTVRDSDGRGGGSSQ